MTSLEVTRDQLTTIYLQVTLAHELAIGFTIRKAKENNKKVEFMPSRSITATGWRQSD